MAAEWYYTHDGERQGPVSSADLKQLVTEGKLAAEDLIWRDGLADWTPASNVKGLFAAADPGGGPTEPHDAATHGAVARPRRAAAGRNPAMQIPLLIGALALTTAYFLPWWGVSLKGDPDEVEKEFSGRGDFKPNETREEREARYKRSREKTMELARKVVGSIGWYARNVEGLSATIKQIPMGPDEEFDISGKIWGWNTDLGFGALLLGWGVLPFCILSLASPRFRDWSWVSSLIAAYLGSIIVICSLVWYLGSPGFDVGSVFKQYVIVGPYLVFAGGLLLVVFGTIDGIAGAKALRRKQKAATTV